MLSVYDVSVEVVNRLATETNMLIPTSFPTSSEKMNLELMQVLDFIGVNDGVRTRDNRNHNPGLYQLSYAHHNDICNKNGTLGRSRTCDPRLRRPLLYPAELQAQILVGVEGFEPPTSCSQSRRATKLRYTPMLNLLEAILNQPRCEEIEL